MMSRRIAAAAFFCLALGAFHPVHAGALPTVQLSPASQPKACTTPGRLMAFLAERNARLNPKFSSIAVDYMRHGRALGVRWDYAFFQMVVETNSLRFTGDVSPDQNNFAGLGATGGGVKGEAFRTVSDGVRAHLEHLLLYSGAHVENPVADRTRKVQSWGILDKWRRKFSRPITFSDVGAQWAPSDRGYADDIEAIAQTFYRGHCGRPDPAPELLAAATGGRQRTAAYEPESALGASNIVPPATASNQPAVTGGFTMLNRPAPPPGTMDDNSTTETATAAGKFAVPAIEPPPAAPACRVWTASYGGSKATIIRSQKDGTTNYTVLDVNPGREEAETRAYIAAYAQGGNRIGDYPNKAAALDKAFVLCPEK